MEFSRQEYWSGLPFPPLGVLPDPGIKPGSPTLQVHTLPSKPPGKRPHGLYSPWNSPGQDTGVGSLSLLQGIFPTQESNWGLPHCRWILYQLSHKGSGRILEWVAYPFSSRSAQPRNWIRVSHIAGGFFTSWEPWGKLISMYWLLSFRQCQHMVMTMLTLSPLTSRLF